MFKLFSFSKLLKFDTLCLRLFKTKLTVSEVHNNYKTNYFKNKFIDINSNKIKSYKALYAKTFKLLHF